VIRSMTGYGRKEAVEGGKKILAEIKSVNHRYSDYSIKVPRYFGFLEDKVREYISGFITRGKVDVWIAIESYGESDKEVILDTELAQSYIDALRTLRDMFELKDDITASSVARYTELFQTQRKEEDQEELWNGVKTVLEDAVSEFVAMREREGQRIGKDLRARIEYMKTIAHQIDLRSPETVKEYEQRLYEKIKEILAEQSVDDARILTEVAIFADKVAVNEETVRLASHFDEFHHIMDSDGPCGRKLDFLIQEINREINTIGSKANDIEIAKMVVQLKAELEKLREQVQNIE
jgi:uncharacterized protein (TIGR00255 family)